jgi:hypothetical protein
MNPIKEIDMNEMYKNMKQRYSLDTKQIKKLLLYNYLNDQINTIVIDCRKIDSLTLPSKIKTSSRLILILNDNDNIKQNDKLKPVCEFIKQNDDITNGIFHIFNKEYLTFLNEYSFLYHVGIINKDYLPLCVVNGVLFVGGFINSKNKKNLANLKIKSIVSFMKEPDKELNEMYRGCYRNFTHEEAKHDEVEFKDIVDYLMEEIERKQIPILIYCFSGQTTSIAVATAFIMKYKKWPLELAVGYVMKLTPCINVPAWLYTQLQRVNLNDK